MQPGAKPKKTGKFHHRPVQQQSRTAGSTNDAKTEGKKADELFALCEQAEKDGKYADAFRYFAQAFDRPAHERNFTCDQVLGFSDTNFQRSENFKDKNVEAQLHFLRKAHSYLSKYQYRHYYEFSAPDIYQKRKRYKNKIAQLEKIVKPTPAQELKSESTQSALQQPTIRSANAAANTNDSKTEVNKAQQLFGLCQAAEEAGDYDQAFKYFRQALQRPLGERFLKHRAARELSDENFHKSETFKGSNVKAQLHFLQKALAYLKKYITGHKPEDWEKLKKYPEQIAELQKLVAETPAQRSGTAQNPATRPLVFTVSAAPKTSDEKTNHKTSKDWFTLCAQQENAENYSEAFKSFQQALVCAQDENRLSKTFLLDKASECLKQASAFVDNNPQAQLHFRRKTLACHEYVPEDRRHGFLWKQIEENKAEIRKLEQSLQNRSVPKSKEAPQQSAVITPTVVLRSNVGIAAALSSNPTETVHTPTDNNAFDVSDVAARVQPQAPIARPQKSPPPISPNRKAETSDFSGFYQSSSFYTGSSFYSDPFGSTFESPYLQGSVPLDSTSAPAKSATAANKTVSDSKDPKISEPTPQSQAQAQDKVSTKAVGSSLSFAAPEFVSSLSTNPAVSADTTTKTPGSSDMKIDNGEPLQTRERFVAPAGIGGEQHQHPPYVTIIAMLHKMQERQTQDSLTIQALQRQLNYLVHLIEGTLPHEPAQNAARGRSNNDPRGLSQASHEALRRHLDQSGVAGRRGGRGRGGFDPYQSDTDAAAFHNPRQLPRYVS